MVASQHAWAEYLVSEASMYYVRMISTVLRVVSVGHFVAWHRREHSRLVGTVLISRTLYIDTSLTKYAAHACWEATTSTAVDFPDA